MRKDVFGIIYAGEESRNLRELTAKRSIGALPVGARYRAMDFPLSNMVNSGIRNIAVIPRKKYQSLMDHLGSGKEWDLARKSDGLFIIPPYDTADNMGSFVGLLDTLKGASSYLRHAPQKYCLLTDSCHVYNATYNEMFDFHIASGADITMMYYNDENGVLSGTEDDVTIDVDDNGKVINIKKHAASDAFKKVGLGVYVIRKDLLQYIVEDSCARGKYHLARNVLMEHFNDLKICAYEHKSFVGKISSVASYHKLNMDMLDYDVQKDLFHTGNKIYTKIKDEAPTKYGEEAYIKNSLVGSGCTIEGVVENSVIFRGVHIGKDTVVKNSIIMQSSEIYDGSLLDNVILDKEIIVRPNSLLAGTENYPVIIPKGANV